MRLSSAQGFTDDGIKTFYFDGSDGQGMMGYAGLGRTATSRQPSDWMKDQLVGRAGLTTENYIGIVAEAAKAQLPIHLQKLPHSVQSHNILAPAIVNRKPRIYHIGVSTTSYIYTRYVNEKAMQKPPRIALAGSGASLLNKDKSWQRGLLRLLAAYEQDRLDPRFVADRLAELNAQVAGMDRFVSQKCIVSWRRDGGGMQFYEGTQRVQATGEIPTAANGMDIQAIIRGSLPFMMKQFDALRDGHELEIDGKAIEDSVNREHKPPKRDLR